MTDEPMKSDKNNHPSVFLISIGLLATALVVIVAVLINPLLQANPGNPTGTEMPTTGYVQPETSRQETTGTLATGKIPTGVSLFGIDVSGLAKDELVAATSHLPELIMSRIEIPVQVDGEKTVFSAQGLGMATDYDLVIRQVMAYGQTGTAAEKQQALDEAKHSGVNFTIHTVASMAKITAALLPLKEKVDIIPVNASSVFMPWGYSADGKAYQPDVKKMADAHSVGKSYSRPELVRIDPADKPNAIRYQYWQTDHYVKGYIPADAAISRFLYVPETSGRSLDVEALARQIMAQVESGQYSEIATSCLVIEPSVKIADLKNDTRLIASWTSSYRSHAGTSRNWNVSRMSSFINGAVIQPGQKWSVNKTAGYRTDATALTVGWKKAAGIENVGYTQQVGGGVCQLGSTTFNAAIRAGITIASSTHHTIPSDYIPLGLDATLSSPSPDLVLQNNNPNPFYLVSYVNPKDQNVTVEVYGRLPVDPVHGQVIYDFTSNNRGTRYGTPTMSLFYNATVAPDETVLDELHPVYVYAEPRTGIEIQTYKQIYSLAGKALGDPIPYELHKYPVINGRTYMFGPDPATITPTPTPTPTLTPTPGPTPSPTPSPDKHLNKPF